METERIETDRISVSVSIPPQAYFVERVAGDLVETNILVGAGDDPHSYEPTPRQMQSISSSQVYFSIGVEFEDAWLPRFTSAYKELLIVDTAIDIERMPMEDKHDEKNEGVDPHIWLSPKLVKLQVQIIADTLVALDPANKPTYQAGLDSFISDIDQLELAINEQFTPLSFRKFITIHPSLGYFAKDYNLEMIPVEVEGKEPGAEELSKIIDLARANKISVIFTQQAFSSKNAEVLADEIGARVVVLNPLAYEWMSNMQIIANEVEASMVKN
jgi:zinc transport system substrate-binding protein